MKPNYNFRVCFYCDIKPDKIFKRIIEGENFLKLAEGILECKLVNIDIHLYSYKNFHVLLIENINFELEKFKLICSEFFYHLDFLTLLNDKVQIIYYPSLGEFEYYSYLHFNEDANLLGVLNNLINLSNE